MLSQWFGSYKIRIVEATGRGLYIKLGWGFYITIGYLEKDNA